MILINGIFSFWQKYKAERAVVALRQLLPQKVKAQRGGETVEMLAADSRPATSCCWRRATSFQPTAVCSRPMRCAFASRPGANADNDAMSPVQSFAPIENAKARVLILGSMPGKASLAAGQYYAHAQNLFWRILGEVTGAAPESPYSVRARALTSRGIALWDVLASCVREGSLDAAIDDTTISANDFVSFYRAHPRIAQVFFNGAKAEACYRRHVLPVLAQGFGPQQYSRLPSTSPANASISRAYKHRVWQQALRRALAGRSR